MNVVGSAAVTPRTQFTRAYRSTILPCTHDCVGHLRVCRPSAAFMLAVTAAVYDRVPLHPGPWVHGRHHQDLLPKKTLVRVPYAGEGAQAGTFKGNAI